MAKRKKHSGKRNKRKFLTTEITFLLIIALCLGLTLYFHNQTIKLKDDYSTYQKELKKVKKNLSSKEKELKDVEDKIASYSKIDDTINNTKIEFFKTISALENDITEGKSTKKIAYLTFDDGPYFNTYTVLDILDQYGAKATFFTISMNGEYCFDNKSANCFALYKEYVKRGHTIANHTYTHAINGGLYSSADSFMDAVVRQEEHIKNQTGGYTTNIVRFPGGSSQAKGLKEPIIEKLRERGYGWVDWTALDGDGKALSSKEEAFGNFTSSMDKNIEVVLLHDYNKYTTQILPDMITYLKQNNYLILPLFYDSKVINK